MIKPIRVLGALLSAVTALQAATPPSTHVGSYEALLFSESESTGLPAGFVTLKTTAKGTFTGKLTTDENKSYSFSSKFDYNAETDTAITVPSLINISRGSKLPSLGLSLALKNAGATLEATLTLSGAPNRVATTGVKLTPRDKNSTDKWPGKYTLAFSPSGPVTGPNGSSYAGGVVDKAGVLKVAGKLADGTTLTASLYPDASRSYRTYLNVLKAPGSYFAGKIDLVSNGADGFHVVTATAPDADFWWAKPGSRPKDKSYRNGFGPLKLLLTMEPWTLPAKGQTLAQLLGIVSTEKTFQFDFSVVGAGIDFSSYLGTIPAKLTLDAKNMLVPVFGDLYAPSIAAEWAKIWSGKVDPNTGIYSGSFTLTELIDTDGPIADPKSNALKQNPIKIIKRKVSFQGVLFNSANPLAPLAAGNFILPPLDSKQETLAGAVDIPDELEDLGTGAPVAGLVSPGTPGTYEVNPFSRIEEFDWSNFPASGGVGVTVRGSITGLPANNSRVSFTISPDLGTLTLNGRKVPLVGDGRPSSLVYSDATSKNYKKTLTVVVYLNTTTGRASGIFANYIQLLPATYTVFGRKFSAFVPGVAIYQSESQPTPIKVK